MPTPEQPTPAAPRSAAVYAGVAVLAACVLMLQVVATRILSVATWYYLAFFTISMAMFGLSAGALHVYRRPAPADPEATLRAMARATLGLAVSIPICLALQLSLAPAFVPTITIVACFAFLALAIAVPYRFAGIALALALTRTRYPVGRMYAADLCGAGVGCLGALGLLELTDGPSAVLWIAALAALAAALLGARARHALGLAGLLAVAALLNGIGNAGLRPLLVKGQVETFERIAFTQWNSFSRIAATQPFLGPAFFWGASRSDALQTRIEQLKLDIDGDAGTWMVRSAGHPVSDFRFLGADVTNLAHALPDRGRAAIVGVGGGRDVLAALAFGKREVTGIEVNPIFVQLLTRHPDIAPFAGLATRPGVRLVSDEARSWLARSAEDFDFIQMSLTDTWAATGAGAFTLSENALYTEEAWAIVLARLSPRGVFTVSRWYHPDHLYETGRLLSLAVAALLEAGVAHPREHLFMATNRSPNRPSGVVTLILTRAPLAPDEIDALETEVAAQQHTVLLSPRGDPPLDLLRALADSDDRRTLDGITARERLELRPPTDDRPFFFNYLRLDRPGEILSRVGLLVGHEQTAILGGVIVGNVTALLTLATIILVSLVLVTLVVVVPARRVLVDCPTSVVVPATAYFLLIGLGYMLVEIALMQRTSVFLGYPPHSLGLVLFGMIGATGLGSLLCDRWPLRGRAGFVGWPLATAGYLLALAFVAPVLFDRFEDDRTLVRAAIALAVIVPAGILMGYGMPTGLARVAAIDSRPTPWLWGVNGAAGVLAGGLAIVGSLAFGIAATLIAGAVCYALLVVPLTSLVRSRA